MLHHPKTLSSLTPIEQTHLANLLTLPPHHLTTTGQPSPAWLATQSHLITTTTTPPALRAPQTLFARLLFATTSITITSSHRAVLCSAHQRLNNRLVHAVFSLLTAEIGRKALPLRLFARHPARYYHAHHAHSGDARRVRALVDRLAGMEALWLDPREFARTYPGLCTRHGFVEGRCEACILAVVGGDEGLLRDLGAVVVGRTHTKRSGRGSRRSRRSRKGSPVLGGLIGAWVRQGKMDEGERVRMASEKLGRVVKRVKRAVRRQDFRKGSFRSASRSNDRNGRERARDRGYGSATNRGVDLAAWKSIDKRVPGIGEHASSRPLCGQVLDRHGEELILNSAVENDVFVRKRETPLHQPGYSNASTTTQTAYQHTITENKEKEYDVYIYKKQPTPHQNQQLDALNASSSSSSSSSSSTLHISQPFSANRKNKYDDEEDLDKRRLGMWCGTHTHTVNGELHPALRPGNTLAIGEVDQDGRRDSAGAMVGAMPLAPSLAEDVSQSGETYDPEQWTDVSVATRELKEGRGEVAGSSSVYSTAETTLRHPSISAASTMLRSNTFRRLLTPSEELDLTMWPNPFAEVAPTAISSGGNSQTPSSTSSSSSAASQRTAAGTVDSSSSTAARLSPAEFQRALDRLQELSLGDAPGRGELVARWGFQME